MKPEFPPVPGKIYTLPKSDTWPESSHLFSVESIWALRAAIAAGRPLLLRGEPGIGKSQLARAAAYVLKVPFLSHVMHERSERDDLLYQYDAVARLARAQMGPQAFKEANPPVEGKTGITWTQSLEESRFICPGVLWWAYHWQEAAQKAKDFKAHNRGCFVPSPPEGWDPLSPHNLCGPVVLIDEIDKADPSVPNGLLESLGNEGFNTPQLESPVRLPQGAKAPLIIITTNEERELPAAFLRRCLVLQMEFPKESDFKAVRKFLIDDRAHSIKEIKNNVSDDVCEMVITQLLKDRQDARQLQQPLPGAAEFLDVVRVLARLHPGKKQEQVAALENIQSFAFKKNFSPSSEEAPRQ